MWVKISIRNASDAAHVCECECVWPAVTMSALLQLLWLSMLRGLLNITPKVLGLVRRDMSVTCKANEKTGRIPCCVLHKLSLWESAYQPDLCSRR